MFGKKKSQQETTRPVTLEILGLETLSESEQRRVSGGYGRPVHIRLTPQLQMESERGQGGRPLQ
ncbi:MAG TPA: hypothetical protein VFF73_06780 [Planctomycetota bacterium]|nr:hypothetical protein [Planctomycetota bacterium]